MKVKFTKPKAVVQEDIIAFAQAIGHTVSSELERFFFEFNGSKPEANIFAVGKDNESGVNELIAVQKILEEREYLSGVGEEVYPVAIAEGGNYVVVDFERNQSVYFWDHEQPENMVKLARNIYEFLDCLKSFDPDDVELKEGQVEFAWIDPEFLKSLK
ncbi:SMI1-KNR4 cell-wall [Pseudomonas syringae]|uniref:SMI1/KNR4 family protein n=1 Tax=Pseudomonas syringae TaxID=317 RepID=UPI000899F00A|nr:SMI1/KNR4 family protein [Pseudomonas syringae]SDX78747.1 SMI1-KNR4 cell-wall [Pseudomonas syringae]SFM85593.1 SMI1-KNR4 cell-wall [Pseudomonas syringae]